MANLGPRAGQTTLSPLGHDTSIRLASRSPARAFLAVTGAVVLLWFLAAMSGCSSTATGDAPGAGGGLDATDGAAPDAGVCCSPDQVRSGCMNLGGYSAQECSSARTCDFFCSTNWRIEADSHGCPTWRYDVRSPAPGESPICLPLLDGGSPG